jgi:hypothetical protein
MNVRRKREGRQLVLTEQSEESPPWGALPEEVRGEVVALLAKLLSSELSTDEEVADE